MINSHSIAWISEEISSDKLYSIFAEQILSYWKKAYSLKPPVWRPTPDTITYDPFVEAMASGK